MRIFRWRCSHPGAITQFGQLVADDQIFVVAEGCCKAATPVLQPWRNARGKRSVRSTEAKDETRSALDRDHKQPKHL
jgi:hypothetical protein